MAVHPYCAAKALAGLLPILLWIDVNARETSVPHVALHVESQPMVDALIEWARQTGLELVFPDADGAKNLTAPAVTGDLTPQAGLDRLLEGSPLAYRFFDATTVVIRQRDPRDDPAPLPVAAGSSTVTEIANLHGSISAGSEAGPPFEIVVVGSRILPLAVFDRTEIDALGASTVGEVLRYLPQQSYHFEPGFGPGGAQFADLRGLGIDSTLVLINGRRMVPSAASVAFTAFDLNAIPLVAVERIEVLSGSTSAMYGADAIGGVVNIVMKERIARPILNLHYGSAAGGGEERRVSVSAGHAAKRWRASVVLDYFDRGYLLGAERERWRDQDYRRFGSVDRRSLNAHPGNISSLTTDNLPGLDSPIAAVPRGDTGTNPAPADFAATAGAPSRDSVQRYWSIVPETDRRSVAAFAEYELSPRRKLYGELLYTDRHEAFQFEPTSLSGAVVPATNPFNPFGAPVAVHRLFAEIGPRELIAESTLTRLVAGLKGALRSFEWEISAVGSAEKGAVRLENQLDPVRTHAALIAMEPNESLNVFRDGPAGDPSLLASLIATPTVHRYGSDGTQLQAFLRGAPLELPAGNVELIVGGEWRREDVFYGSSAQTSSSHRTVSAAFSEMRVPLAGFKKPLPALHELSLTLSGRHDHYARIGGTFNPQYGLSWKPIRDLMLRVSHGTSFRPPSLFELHAPRTTIPIFITDPRRNHELASPVLVAGGNPDLAPIDAESFTAGFALIPSAVSGLQISGGYWRIEMDRKISVLPAPSLLEHEERFSSRIVRADPTPADVAAGLPGRLQSVDASYINIGSLDTSGVDLEASWAFDTRVGRFTPHLSATWVEQYRIVNLPDEPAVERTGVASLFGTIPRWRATAKLEWKRDSLQVSATARYLPSYKDAALNGPNGRSIPSQVLLDLQGALDLNALTGPGSSWSEGLMITAGVWNLFDEAPPFAEVGFTAGYDISQGDLRQRFGYLKVSKSF